MCGISGFISDKRYIKKDSINSTLDLMGRRGPDAKNYFIEDNSSKQIGLLHTRLNIIDLNDRSNQPFRDGNFILIFNGEIYNYVELRNILKKKYNFKTDSDTEVLIKCYQEYGEHCVDHLVGMWSFAIWDLKNKKLFLSRDPFGEKPLFFFKSEKCFFFGSEIKYIKSLCNIKFDQNKQLLHDNLFLGYKSLNKTNKTFYNNIFSLESSHNLSIDLDLKLKKTKYWKPNVDFKNDMSSQEASEGVNFYLLNSLKIRMRSDVPIAFCLSGGIDSGLLASHAKKSLNKDISTFSIIDDDERYNEKDNIQIICNDLNTKPNFINLRKEKKNFLDRLRKLTFYHDGPIATLSYYIHSFLSEDISKNNYKVAISGTGADELFTGYFEHFLLHLQTLSNTEFFEPNLRDWEKFIKPNIRNEFLKDPLIYVKNPKNRDNIYEKNFNLIKYSNFSNNNEFSENYYTNELLRNRMLNELFHEVVPVILKHDDLNSMYFSIENRSPYLDRDLLNFSLTIPPNLLINNGFQKKVLRDSAKGVLNENIRNFRQKKGFNASIHSVIDINDSDNYNFIFDERSEISELIDLNHLKRDINKDFTANHVSKIIFSILTTKMFMEQS